MTDSKPLNRQELGQEAETTARSYLVSQGLKIILENFRCRIGELDIVALHEKVLVIAEVRFRSRTRHADAATSVGPMKRRRIIAASKYLLLTRPHFSRFPVRFDVIALDRLAPQDPSRIEWIRSAFESQAW